MYWLTISISFQNLEAILNKSVKECSILSAYKFHGQLDERNRNTLADIIIHRELKKNLDARLVHFAHKMQQQLSSQFSYAIISNNVVL